MRSTDSVSIAPREERTIGAPLLVSLTGRWQGRVVRIDGDIPDATLSLSEWSISRKHANVLAEEADRSAYVAKQHGRNCVACRLTGEKTPVGLGARRS